MVGVPGRSKGCATCKRRKKGCDLQRPACGQCVRSGLDCAGYDRQRVFINYTTSPPSSHALMPAPKHRFPAKPPNHVAEIVLPTGLTRTAYELKSLGLFWEAYLPRGMAFASASAAFTTGSWLGTIDSTYSREDTLKYALLAISLATVGRQRNDVWMVSQGYALHGRALRKMAVALQTPERAPKDELLAASKLLGLFEILFGADDRDMSAQARSWSSHAKGEPILFEARGPHAHMHGNAHQFFVDGRLGTVIDAARARKKSVLSEPEWKDIPWRSIPKTPKDVLLDIMIDLPTLMEKLDGFLALDLAHADPARALRQQALMQDCWAADRRLAAWLATMRSAAAVDLGAVEHVSQLGNFAAAQLTYYYWAACIMLYSMLHSANAAAATAAHHHPAILPPRTDPRVYVRRIARSAAYFFAPEAGIFGSHAAAFPIGLVLFVLRRSLLATGGSSSRSSSSSAPDEAEDYRQLTSVFRISGVGVTIDKFLKSILTPPNRWIGRMALHALRAWSERSR